MIGKNGPLKPGGNGDTGHFRDGFFKEYPGLVDIFR